MAAGAPPRQPPGRPVPAVNASTTGDLTIAASVPPCRFASAVLRQLLLRRGVLCRRWLLGRGLRPAVGLLLPRLGNDPAALGLGFAGGIVQALAHRSRLRRRLLLCRLGGLG